MTTTTLQKIRNLLKNIDNTEDHLVSLQFDVDERNYSPERELYATLNKKRRLHQKLKKQMTKYLKEEEDYG